MFILPFVPPQQVLSGWLYHNGTGNHGEPTYLYSNVIARCISESYPSYSTGMQRLLSQEGRLLLLWAVGVASSYPRQLVEQHALAPCCDPGMLLLFAASVRGGVRCMPGFCGRVAVLIASGYAVLLSVQFSACIAWHVASCMLQLVDQWAGMFILCCCCLML